MARISDVPADHQRHARTVYPSILASITAAELRYRAAYAARLSEDAKKSPILEHSTFLNKRARVVMRSKPALEFVHRDRELGQLAQEASRRLEWGSDGKAQSIAGAYEAMRRNHRESNSYPPGLLQALDQALLGKPVGEPAMAELVDAILSHQAAA